MAKIHMVLQGKGGVGKSFIASTLAQHKLAKGKKLLCIDTDPVNATFNGFKKLNVRQVNVMSGDEIDARRFDELIELIAKAEGDVIIDNGASTFVPMSHYLISNQIPALLHDLDHELVVHTVITGSQALLDTLNGFSQLIKQFPKEVLFVVWLNPYWGEITMDGKQFEEMRVYLDNKARVSAIIRIPDYKADTFGKDLSQILQAKLTFSEALENKTLPIMVRQRLTIIKKQLFTNIENVAAVLT
ncbi:MAG: AAA family ATPase [Burkholderiales bacterium]|nr:AAA family ATPase [Burkholderiales bacterium]